MAAITAGWSAAGRPIWLEASVRDIECAYLTAQVVEGPGVLRCLVTVCRRDGDMVAFTLDVSGKTFDGLPTITATETVALLHRFMATAPFLPVESMPDPDYEG